MLQELKAKRNELILEKIKNNKFYNLGVNPSEEQIQELLKFGELNDLVLDFINKFNANFKDYNYLLFKNLKDLHIYINHYEDEEVLFGYFNNNKINISIGEGLNYNPNEDGFKLTLYNALLHSATYDSKSDVQGEGLYKRVYGSNIGHRLNEGYTELLVSRYFSDKNVIYCQYHDLEYARKVEKLIGKEEMEKAFFTGDLYSIIDGLGKYIDNPLKFMQDVDNNKIDPNEFLSNIKQTKSKELIKR